MSVVRRHLEEKKGEARGEGAVLFCVRRAFILKCDSETCFHVRRPGSASHLLPWDFWNIF